MFSLVSESKRTFCLFEDLTASVLDCLLTDSKYKIHTYTHFFILYIYICIYKQKVKPLLTHYGRGFTFYLNPSCFHSMAEFGRDCWSSSGATQLLKQNQLEPRTTMFRWLFHNCPKQPAFCLKACFKQQEATLKQAMTKIKWIGQKEKFVRRCDVRNRILATTCTK